ncbi:molecular chaperone DnaJ [Leptolyngbya sp. 'hensonii']|uniref:J domain-containing protein n=1 Tax=Leptolyngbya sp. 'hensonii' TaxID=1922337 RepID=UPI00095011F0|nr:DnaJ domain-containing protein [Leptolyngbya sp. 'hensonii']OLP16713.1 molecular chaperone DnaJ [Leptolyngbya sp. 'hensonii']
MASSSPHPNTPRPDHAYSANHYDTLEVQQTATQADIKRSYRLLVRKFHPDTSSEVDSHDRLTQINAAYEVLSDPCRRQSYDRQLHFNSAHQRFPFPQEHRPKTGSSQAHYRTHRRAGQQADEHLQQWLNQVYTPVSRCLSQILNPLHTQINHLAADPFDDQLMEDFQAYLETCQDYLQQAQNCFRSMPNPSTVAGVAAHLYYCLNQIGDGIEELNLFTLNYDDHHLHTGQELFRIAAGLRREAQAALKI